MKTKHGLTGHPLYLVWENMKKRCYNKNNHHFPRYGGRGIKVCKEWVNNFKKFYDFCMDNGWNDKLQIDRRKNDLGYNPLNCRFVTCAVNNQNRGNNKLNWDLVTEIRNAKLLIPNLKLKEISLSYGISLATASLVLRNKSWVL